MDTLTNNIIDTIRQIPVDTIISTPVTRPSPYIPWLLLLLILGFRVLTAVWAYRIGKRKISRSASRILPGVDRGTHYLRTISCGRGNLVSEVQQPDAEGRPILSLLWF